MRAQRGGNIPPLWSLVPENASRIAPREPRRRVLSKSDAPLPLSCAVGHFWAFLLQIPSLPGALCPGADGTKDHVQMMGMKIAQRNISLYVCTLFDVLSAR